MNLSAVFKFNRKKIIYTTLILLILLAFCWTGYNWILPSEVKAEKLELIRTAQREQGALAIINFENELHYVWQGEEIAGFEFIRKEADMAVLTAEEETYYLSEGESLPSARNITSPYPWQEDAAEEPEAENESPDRERLSRGSRGGDVVFLQHILYQTDYLDLVPNGYFGEQTEAAVKRFQRYHGLNANGIVNDSTWDKLKQGKISGFDRSAVYDEPETPAEEIMENEFLNHEFDINVLPEYGQISPQEFDLLARIIHGKSQGEPYKGKVAVGAVVINRVLSPRFPPTINEVIYQEGQFSPVEAGAYLLPPSEKSQQAAREALAGEDPTQGALYFYNPDRARDAGWVQYKETLVRIGNHLFLR